jgi:hypothetical protein
MSLLMCHEAEFSLDFPHQEKRNRIHTKNNEQAKINKNVAKAFEQILYRKLMAMFAVSVFISHP